MIFLCVTSIENGAFKKCFRSEQLAKKMNGSERHQNSFHSDFYEIFVLCIISSIFWCVFMTRMMCSCGFHMWLSARNGYVELSESLFIFTQSMPVETAINFCWASLIRKPKVRSARCSQPCWLSTLTNQVKKTQHQCRVPILLDGPWYEFRRTELKIFTLALWIMAAKSELEDRNSSESARHLFLRALRFHPDNKKVYQEVKRGNGKDPSVWMQGWVQFLWCSSEFSLLVCISTSVWSYCTARSWGSRRKSWRKPKWIWWEVYLAKESQLFSFCHITPTCNIFIGTCAIGRHK